MPVGLLGQKIGMTQVYNESGVLVPVTVIQAGPCSVLQVRTLERDGYEAVQIGYGDKPRRLAIRSERGHVASISSKRRKTREEAGVELLGKAGCEPKKFIKEFRTDGENCDLEVGAELTVTHLADLKFIDVIGTSKGRGFAGVMKRHNFSGQRASHGVKRVHRHGGSIGQSADPSRVMKGTKMPGRYGSVQRTVRYLEVVRLDEENNLVLVKGAIPGPNGGEVILRHSTKNRYKNQK
ncbi:50S ribosomal protein L3 [Polystyrenella longa]|uniref:Large ribosomal subunit protein uL3 n=1 Tax=Polystyrenella longa TaxID=2528007 RepID=A0A518CR90_9PLAN|nr:50S ribosomal protein L3 [Polystyrenella longa]QDU81749.1 50S ribosomal protein L3 [Polystyrenella longa]